MFEFSTLSQPPKPFTTYAAGIQLQQAAEQLPYMLDMADTSCSSVIAGPLGVRFVLDRSGALPAPTDQLPDHFRHPLTGRQTFVAYPEADQPDKAQRLEHGTHPLDLSPHTETVRRAAAFISGMGALHLETVTVTDAQQVEVVGVPGNASNQILKNTVATTVASAPWRLVNPQRSAYLLPIDGISLVRFYPYGKPQNG